MDVILEGRGLSFAYAGRGTIFENVSIAVEPGEVFCVLGPNGVGKSTFLACLCGLLNPQDGETYLDGKPISRISRREIARGLAFVAQAQSSVFDFPVRIFVEMGRAAHLGSFASPGMEGTKKTYDSLERLGIAHLAERSMSEISGGERQLATIARAFVQEPRVIILDEPAAHLDFGNQARLLDTIEDIASAGLSVVFTTHLPDHADAVADRTMLLRRGGCPVTGKTRSVLTEALLSQTYGLPVPLTRTSHGIHTRPARRNRGESD